MSLSRDCESRAEPAESQGGRHGNRISGPSHMELRATESTLQGTTGGRDWCLWHPRAPMTWHPPFSFLPPSWRNPESHVLKLPAVWFLVAEDVICAHTNCPPPSTAAACPRSSSCYCSFLPQFFSIFPFLPTLGPGLAWHVILLVPARV